jgi:hypothetical protein
MMHDTTAPDIDHEFSGAAQDVDEEAPDASGASPTSIEDHKLVWMTCEESKSVPRTKLKEIAKKQRTSTKALRAHMEDEELDRLDCGGGWFMTHESVEKVTFTEDVCGPYMDAHTLERLKQEQKKRKSMFKTIPPAKRPRENDDS